MIIENKHSRGILIVDDEESIRKYIEERLRALGYQNLYLAENGLKALELIALHCEQIYTIILDLKMPIVDGHEFILQLMNIHKQHVGIVIFTGYYSKDILTRYQGLNDDLININTVVEKPATRDLFAKVEECLNDIHKKRTGHHNQLIQNQRIQLDVFSRKLDQLIIVANQIRNSQKNWIEQIGMEIVKTIVIAIFVIVYFKVSTSDVVSRTLNNSHTEPLDLTYSDSTQNKSDSQSEVEIPNSIDCEINLILNSKKIPDSSKVQLINSYLNALK